MLFFNTDANPYTWNMFDHSPFLVVARQSSLRTALARSVSMLLQAMLKLADVATKAFFPVPWESSKDVMEGCR